MSERVEEIRRQAIALHNELGRIFLNGPSDPAVDDRMVAAIEVALLTALAQAEREREEFKEAFRQQSAFTEELTQKWDAARAEVERLNEQADLIAMQRDALATDLARVRGALTQVASEQHGGWHDLSRSMEECQQYPCTLLRRAALEGRP